MQVGKRCRRKERKLFICKYEGERKYGNKITTIEEEEYMEEKKWKECYWKGKKEESKRMND